MLLSVIMASFWCQQIQEEMKVRLVELDVRVINLLHQPVSGLSRDLFRVKEDGEQRSIEHFEEISYLDMLPGEAYESPRLLLLFNFMDDPNNVTRYIDEVESYLLYKETGAWQIGIGAITRSGIQILSPFTHDQSKWIEGILAARDAYRTWDDRTLYTNANSRDQEDVTRRESKDYGFETNTQALSATQEGDIGAPPALVSPLGNVEEKFAEKESPALELDPRALSRFIRLLSAYDGIKEILVLGPELWEFQQESDEHWIRTPIPEFVRPQSLAAYSASNRTGDLRSAGEDTGFDLQEMLTNCVKSKIRLNRLETTHDIKDHLVSASGGSTYACNIKGIQESIDRFLDRAGHMYRLRYSTEIDDEDTSYRRIDVGVKGVRLIAEHVNRFYPRLLNDTNQLTAALDVDRNSMTFKYTLPWDALYFERDGNVNRAQLAVSQKVYFNHRLVFENVRVFQPEQPVTRHDGRTNLTDDELDIEFDLPVYEEGSYRVEFESIDLINGRRSEQDLFVDL